MVRTDQSRIVTSITATAMRFINPKAPSGVLENVWHEPARTASGQKLAPPLFDGSEQLISVTSLPWCQREVFEAAP